MHGALLKMGVYLTSLYMIRKKEEWLAASDLGLNGIPIQSLSEEPFDKNFNKLLFAERVYKDME